MVANSKVKQAKSINKRLPARDLRIHPHAQRDIIPSQLKKLVDNMDLDLIGTVHAVEQAINGKQGVWVVDGQHRIMALMELGLGDWICDVEIHTDAKEEKRAAELFLGLNSRIPVTPYMRFRNELVAERPEAIGVRNIADTFGIRIAGRTGDGCMCCVSSLKGIFRIDSGKTLTSALRILTEAWGTKANALEGKVLEGIALVSRRYDGKLEIPKLITSLSKYPGGAAGVLGQARGLRITSSAPVGRCVAQVIVSRYNQGRRGGKLDPI